MRILYFQDDTELLRKVCLSQPLGYLFVDWLNKKSPFTANSNSRIVLPEKWIKQNASLKQVNPLSYERGFMNVPISPDDISEQEVYLLNAHALTSLDEESLSKTLRSLAWDVAFVQVCLDLQASKESVKMTPNSQIVGFRRLYAASIEPIEIPRNWPNIIVFKKNAWLQLARKRDTVSDYQSLMSTLRELQLKMIGLSVGGYLAKFDNEAVFLNCLDDFESNGSTIPSSLKKMDIRSAGPFFVGRDVTVEPNVRLIGPVVLSDGVYVKAGAVIRRSVIGDNMTIEGGQFVNNQMRLGQQNGQQENPSVENSSNPLELFAQTGEYRKWSQFSYERLGKRIFDICIALIILTLLIPVFPIIMLTIKLTSKGPIFYKAQRQGLHGREFDCLKFRTMIHKADSIQERLRVVNQVDGPQFKIENDPRISGVGKFLRDTCIDELPQFVNVLLGQMSVVGPRPSPENENDSCPVWRDARLSVRPGITGLWQICRTRRTSSDFQEWVFYDTEYVRNLSFRKDLWICWKTAQKLIKDFLGQFG